MMIAAVGFKREVGKRMSQEPDTDTRTEKPNVQREAASSWLFLPSPRETQSAGVYRLLTLLNPAELEKAPCHCRQGHDLQPVLSQSAIFSDKRMSDSEACTFTSRSVEPSHQSQHQT